MADQNKTATPQRAKGGKKAKKKGPLWRRILTTVGIVVVSLALILTIAGTIFYQTTNLPNPNTDFATNTTFLYYRDGTTKLGSLSIQNRQSIDYAKMPQSIKDAVVSAENRTFWTDKGISIRGMVRSAWTILRGHEVQGGSTITQQYIKIMYLSADRTVSRKLKEVVLASKLSRSASKEQILQDYLNTIYFGRGAYGIQAASKAYFNVDAGKLTVPQSAALASILNNPSLYDPSDADGKTRLLARYRYVLDGMLEMGKITQSQRDGYYKALPSFPDVPSNSRYGGTKGYLMKMVENELKADGFSDSEINGGGLQVTTTFDANLQAAAVKACEDVAAQAAKTAGKPVKNLHPALASVEVGTGDLLAAYGGTDYVANTRNWATTPRPAASTFKAYATVAGLRNGLSLRTILKGNTWTPPGDAVPIHNDDNSEYGPVTLKKAVQSSINTAFVDLVTRINNGPSEVIKAANDAGVPTGAGWDKNDRIALGIAEVSPVANAGGFATFANNGTRVATHVVKQVKDASGKVVYTTKAATKANAIDPDVTKDLNFALEAVVNQGTGVSVSSLGYPTAGKTGTGGIGTKVVSAWFAGYTKQISTAVMYVAGDGGTDDLNQYKVPWNSAFFGGTYPAQTWLEYMKVAMKGKERIPFDQPVYVNGNGTSDQTASTQSTNTQPAGPASSQSAPSSAPASSTSASSAPASSAPATSAPATSAPATSAPATSAPATTATSKTTTTSPATTKATATSAPSQKSTSTGAAQPTSSGT